MNRIKRIFSAIAVLLGIVATFSFKPLQATNIWAIAFSDAVYFYIAEELNGEVQGTHYLCVSDPTTTCVISTPINVVPDAQGRILKSQVTIIVDNANFVDLNPGQ